MQLPASAPLYPDCGLCKQSGRGLAFPVVELPLREPAQVAGFVDLGARVSYHFKIQKRVAGEVAQ